MISQWCVALRAQGHDVTAVGEFQSRSIDKEVMELARSEGRVLLTEDKDFGQLAFAARAEAPGVILIRYPASARATLPAAVQQLVREHGTNLNHAFVVLRPGSVRIRRA